MPDELRQIGPYRIVENLGEGGMGEVYVAEQTEPVRREVALKLIRQGLSSEEIFARFETERQSLALMDHPNIARVYDAGTEEQSGVPYFVMELVRGEPVTRYCDRVRLPLNKRLRLFQQICAGIQHAHQKGVIHRDLKPSNILVTEVDGEPIAKVIDFGVAKALDVSLCDDAMQTVHGQVLGTPQYMSPEQALGESQAVDSRSDVFSLGVILYELITGRTPLDPESLRKANLLELIEMIREVDPPRPSTRLSATIGASKTSATLSRNETSRLIRTLRQDLDWIVLKAIEKEPERRYDSASALAEDVGRFLDSRTVHAAPPSVLYQVKKFTRRNRGLVVTSVAVLATLVLGVAGSTWQAIRATKAERRSSIQERASTARVLADSEPVRALEMALDALEEETAYEGEASSPVLSSLLFTLEANREVARRKIHGGRAWDGAFSPDGRFFAIVNSAGTHLIDRENDISRLILPKEGGVAHRRLAFGPQGRRLVVGDQSGRLTVVGLEGGGKQWSTQAHDAEVSGLVWLGSTGEVMSCGGDGSVRVFSDAGEAREEALAFPISSVGAFAASSDGSWMAAAASELFVTDGLWILYRGEGEGARQVDIGDDFIRALAIDATGERLAGGGLDRTVRFWNREGQDLGYSIRTGHDGVVNGLALHPLQPWVVTASEDSTLRVYTESGLLIGSPIRGHLLGVDGVTVDPGGAHALSFGPDSTVRTWNLDPWQAAPSIHAELNCRTVLFHPDGDRFAAGMMTGEVRFYAYPSGELLDSVMVHSGPCDLLRHQPDRSGMVSAALSANEVKLISWEGVVAEVEFRDAGARTQAIAVDEERSRLFVLGSSNTITTLALPGFEDLGSAPVGGIEGGSGFLPGLEFLAGSDRLLLRGGSWLKTIPADSLAETVDLRTKLAGGGKYRMAVSTDRSLLLTGGRQSSDGARIGIMSLPGLSDVGEIRVPWRDSYIATFSRSAEEIALVSKDGRMQFFERRSGQAIGPVLRAHDTDPRGVGLHPHEEVLVTAGGDGWIRFWHFGQEAWTVAARRQLGRASTPSFRRPSLVAKAASGILSKGPTSGPGVNRNTGGRIEFPEAGLSFEVPDGWVQFEPKALALLGRIMMMVGGEEVSRIQLQAAFSRGSEVQLNLLAPNFYVTTAAEFRGVEAFAEQLPSFQSKMITLFRSRAGALGLGTSVETVEPSWDPDLRAFVGVGTGQGVDGNPIRIRLWMIPTNEHLILLGCFGDGTFVRRVEDIVRTIEVHPSIRPDDEAYAAAPLALERALEKRQLARVAAGRLKEVRQEGGALARAAQDHRRRGDNESALELYLTALEAFERWRVEFESAGSVGGDLGHLIMDELAYRHQVAELQIGLRLGKEAAESAAVARSILVEHEQALKGRWASWYLQSRADNGRDLARAAWLQGAEDEAERWMKEAEACRRERLLVDRHEVEDRRLDIAELFRERGEWLVKEEAFDRAIDSYQRAIEEAFEVPEALRERPWHEKLAGYHRLIAEARDRMGDRAGWKQSLEASVGVFQDASDRSLARNWRFRYASHTARYQVIDRFHKGGESDVLTTLASLDLLLDDLAAFREAVEGQPGAAEDLKSVPWSQFESDRLRWAASLQRNLASREAEDSLERLMHLDQAVERVSLASELHPSRANDDSLQESYKRRSDSRHKLGRHEEAATDRRTRVEVHRRIVAEDDRRHRRLNLARALQDAANSLYKVGDSEAGLVASREAVEIASQLCETEPDYHEAKESLSGFLWTLIRELETAGDPEARQLRQQRVEVAEALLSAARDPENGEDVPLMQVYYTMRGEADYRQGKEMGEAGDWIALYRKAIEAVDRIEAKGNLSDVTEDGREHCRRQIEKLEAGSQ